jgi:hypothetical protein
MRARKSCLAGWRVPPQRRVGAWDSRAGPQRNTQILARARARVSAVQPLSVLDRGGVTCVLGIARGVPGLPARRALFATSRFQTFPHASVGAARGRPDQEKPAVSSGFLVERAGIEPATSGLQSPFLSFGLLWH